MDAVTGFIYGMSMMFFSIMAWMFWRRGPERLFRLIAILMLIADVQCLKDIVLFYYKGFESTEGWFFTSAVDMFIIPFYSFVLMELVKPGWTTWTKAVVLELPFVLLPLLYYYSGHDFFFYILSVWGAIYGVTTFVVLFFLIHQYHRQLKERFSYQENINLNWLIAILGSFFLILIIWTVSCFVVDNTFDNLYMVCSLVIWMFICYFGYRHESVIDELNDVETMPEEVVVEETEEEPLCLANEVQRLFDVEKIYLNPRLKLSDVAHRVGTNRTYLSRYFNQENGQTFYDYVNKLRISHAEHLLRTTADSLAIVAEKSGFNSQSTFRRVFACYHDCSPIEYRKIHTSP